MFNFLVV